MTADAILIFVMGGAGLGLMLAAIILGVFEAFAHWRRSRRLRRRR